MKPSGIITLTTDFGESDPYVAMMKGIILSINPSVQIVDITHQVSAGSIRAGGTIIKEVYTYFPSGTVHVGVIDPGVGGKRRPIAVLADNHFFIGPDNGLFWPITEDNRHFNVIHLKEKRYWMEAISSTFHGRDIFAPVAAHLSRGVDLFIMGQRIDKPVSLAYPLPHKEQNTLTGEVMRVDHFGNLITNITSEDLRGFLASKPCVIAIGRVVLRKIRSTYSDVPMGKPLALIGSSHFLEIAVNRGRAIEDLGVECGVGTEVVVRHRDSSGN